MHKKLILFAIASIVIILPLAAIDVSYNGLSQTSFASRFEEGDIAHYKQSIDLSVDMYKDLSHFFIQPYATIEKDESVSFDIREAYVEIYLDNIDLKIGKQIVVAGEADALYLTDIISPRNLQDFVLTETRDMRKGVPAIKSSLFLGDYTVDAIWITQAVSTTTFSPSSIWYYPPTLLPPTASVTINEPSTPDALLENSEVFGALRYFGSSISYELVGGYTYSDDSHISSLSITSPSPLEVTLEQEYGRYPVVGGSISTTAKSIVIRGEANVSFDKPFSSIDTTGALSVTVENHNYIQGLVGLDWKLLGFDMSLQYMLSYISDYHEHIVFQGKYTDEYSHIATYRMQKKFFEDKFTFQLFTIAELNPINGLIRPSLTYEIEDAVSLKAEVLLFVGDESGVYGKYRDNALTAVSLYWYF